MCFVVLFLKYFKITNVSSKDAKTVLKTCVETYDWL